MAESHMDEFFFVMLVGLLMMIVMIIMWGESDITDTNSTDLEDIEGEFTIGTFESENPRVIRFGDFDISFSLGSSSVTEQSDIYVKKSLFSEQNRKISAQIENDISEVTSAYLIIDVLDTNSQGKLVIKINGDTIYSEITNTGRKEIPIDKAYLEEYNVIEISSSSPGIKIWSSSYYEIENLEFGIKFFGNNQAGNIIIIIFKKPSL